MLTSPFLLALAAMTCGSPPGQEPNPAPQVTPVARPADEPTPTKGPPALGEPAPSFTLRDHTGAERCLEEFLGCTHVLIVFYASDFTPLSTQQMRHFKEHADALAAQGVVILGISDNSWFSHKRFHQWLALNFPLLSDPRGEVATRYDARWRTVETPGSALYFLDRRGVLRWVDRDFRPTQALEFDDLFAAIREANGEALDARVASDRHTDRPLRTTP